MLTMMIDFPILSFINPPMQPQYTYPFGATGLGGGVGRQNV